MLGWEFAQKAEMIFAAFDVSLLDEYADAADDTHTERIMNVITEEPTTSPIPSLCEICGGDHLSASPEAN